MGLTRLSLCTPHPQPPTPPHRNSTSTRNNDPRGLKFCRQPYQANLTTIQHNFNPTIVWGGGFKYPPPKFFYPKNFFTQKFLPKIFFTEIFFDPKIFFNEKFFWPKIFLNPKLLFTRRFFGPKYYFDPKIFWIPKNFWPKKCMTKNFFNQTFI